VWIPPLPGLGPAGKGAAVIRSRRRDTHRHSAGSAGRREDCSQASTLKSSATDASSRSRRRSYAHDDFARGVAWLCSGRGSLAADRGGEVRGASRLGQVEPLRTSEPRAHHVHPHTFGKAGYQHCDDWRVPRTLPSSLSGPIVLHTKRQYQQDRYVESACRHESPVIESIGSIILDDGAMVLCCRSAAYEFDVPKSTGLLAL
jgi:hypothetical protein